LYLKRVLKDFPLYFDKHALDYELTPSEAIFVDEINYDDLEKEQINNWIVKTTPARIVIKEAFYGRGQNMIDVKGKVEELVRVGTYSYPATNEFAGGDPERGQSKGTYVNYTIDGKPYTLTAFSSDTKGFNKNWNGGGVAEAQIAVLIK
jgi:GH18 family chitinase